MKPTARKHGTARPGSTPGGRELFDGGVDARLRVGRREDRPGSHFSGQTDVEKTAENKTRRKKPK